MRALLLSFLVACGGVESLPVADSQPDGGHGHDHHPDIDASLCGNGVLDPGEQCDGGGVDTVTCDADCTAAFCGDGYVNAAAGEQCDGGVGCDASCQLVP